MMAAGTRMTTVEVITGQTFGKDTGMVITEGLYVGREKQGRMIQRYWLTAAIY